jgi:hypothetical protein
MNRKWIYRAVSAAVLAGGMLFAAATTASAGVPVADSAGGATPHHILAPAGFAHPVGARDGIDGTVHTLPYRTDRSPVYLEAASTTPAMPAGNTPTSGMSVDGGKLLSATGGLVQPVQQIGGPAAGPLSGLTGGGTEATTLPIPLSAPTRVLPVSATEGGFTVGQGNQLPGTDLVNQVGSSAGSTVGQLVGGPAGAAMPQGPTGESAEQDPLSNTAGGTDVAGLPLNMVTDPVTSQLNGESDPTGSTTDQPAAPTTDQQVPAAPTGSGDPLSTVTGLLGGLGG